MKKILLALALFWAALSHASSYIIVSGGVSVAGGSRVVVAVSVTTYNSVLFTAASSQRIDIGTAFRPQKTDSFSIDAWVWTKSSGNQTIIGNADGNAAIVLFFNPTAGQFNLQWFPDGAGATGFFSVKTSASYSANAFYHVVATYPGTNSANDIKLYVNGALDVGTVAANTAFTGSVTYGATTRIGADGTVGIYWDGYIYRLAIFNSVLSAGDVTTEYALGHPASITGAAGLAHLYLMGNAANDTSSTIYDQAGTANGTMTNGPAIKTFAPIAMSFVAGNTIGNDAAMFLQNGSTFFFPYYHSGSHTPSSFDAPDVEAYSLSANTLTLLGNLPTQAAPTGSGPYHIIKEGNVGYLGYFQASVDHTYFRSLDLSNPASMSALSSIVDSGIGNLTVGLAKKGNYVYVNALTTPGGTGVLKIVDVSNPNSVSVANTVSTSVYNTGDLVISGNYLFITGQDSVAKGLQIFDIGPGHETSPVSKSVLTTTHPAQTVAIDPAGTYAYVLEWDGVTTSYLDVVNISDVTSPAQSQQITVPYTPQQVLIHPSRRLVLLPCWDSHKVNAYSIYDPPNVFLAKSLTLPNDSHALPKNPQWLGLDGDTLYVANVADTGTPGNMYGYFDVYGL